MQGRDGTQAQDALHSQPGRGAAPRSAAGKVAALVAATAALALAAACSGGGGHATAKAKAVRTPTSATQVTITPANGGTDVKPGAGITVTATRGKLTNVTVQTHGTQVTGTYSDGGTVWRSNWTLGTDQRFLVTATAADKAGKTSTTTSSFHTLSPPSTFDTKIYEGSGETYGVGIPIMLTFSQPITNKAQVERALELRTSKPVVGAWWWADDQTLDFRPQNYWPTNTTVWFTGHLDGVEGAPGVYGTSDLTQSFGIGDSLIVYVSTSGHYMRVFHNGQHIYSWPISTGQPGDDTPNGAFLTIDKGNPVEMKPADIAPGQPGYYDVSVFWSVRFTWSGDYIHSAPWSVGSQGNSNVSHGCVNLGPSYAPIYYKMEVPGDPVIVTGSPVHGAMGDGWTDWFLSWQDVLSKSATKLAVQAGPAGSTFVDPSSLTAPSTAPSASATHVAVPGSGGTP